MEKLQHKSLEDYLDNVDYQSLNTYSPSVFSLGVMNFIKMVNGAQGEANKTPPFHLKMLDGLVSGSKRLINICHRGSGKALALDTSLITPNGFTTISKVQVGDQIIGRDGKPCTVLLKSEVFHKPMYKITLVDGRELKVSEDHLNVVQYKGYTSIAKGKRTTYTIEKVLTTKELSQRKYKIPKRITKRNPSRWEYKYYIPNNKPLQLPEKKLTVDLYTFGSSLGAGFLKETPLKLTAYKDFLCHNEFKGVPWEFLWGSYEQRLALLQGLMDTAGSIEHKGQNITFSSNSLELVENVRFLVYSLGGSTTICHKVTISDKTYWCTQINIGINPFRLPRKAKLFNPNVFKNKTAIVNIERIPDEPSQCLYVSSEDHTFLANDFVVTHNTTIMGEYLILYLACFNFIPNFGEVSGMIYVSDSMENGAKSLRKNIEYRYLNSEFLQDLLPPKLQTFTDNYLEFTNTKGKKLGVRLFGATTGVRGVKLFGKRPSIAILDDLISDSSSKSIADMNMIKEIVYKGINYALDPNHYKIILNGTPFNRQDILLEAIASGVWEVNAYPICEKFPVPKSEFHGVWEDRFPYEYVKEQYDSAVGNGKLDGFQQELMLRINSTENRLIQDEEIRWYSRQTLLGSKHNFNFYISTDFATSAKQTADYSVISVWAYNNNGDWFYVDGTCYKQTMDKNIDDLFRLVQEYSPLLVGVEITGQQGAFINWLQKEMMLRNIYFNFASSSPTNTPGIRPITDKLSRFALVVPWFKAGKMYFPEELKSSAIMKEAMRELASVTRDGIKDHDDFIDTVSQLYYFKTFRPSAISVPETQISRTDNDIYGLDDDYLPQEPGSNLDSYLV